MLPSVSVTICLYNSSRYIDETIQSLLAQSWTDFEAIIIDDGSTDGCADHISKHYPDSRIKIVRQGNRGLGAARAISVAYAQGSYIAFLDHDDVWLSFKLARQIEAVKENPAAALIFCDCLLIDADGHSIGLMSDRYNYEQINLKAGMAHDELLIRGCFIPLSSAMVKASALIEIGGPNPTYQFVEDYDMWLRLSRNHSIHFIDEPLAKWRIHDAQFTQMHPEISAKEHAQVWLPVIGNHTYPLRLRKIVADHLFGQQRCAISALLHQFRPMQAARVLESVIMEPAPALRYLADRAKNTPLKIFVVLALRIRKLLTRLREERGTSFRELLLQLTSQTVLPKSFHIWIDGTSLISEQAGYFNSVCEMVRSLVKRKGIQVHVTTPWGGQLVLCSKLGKDASKVQFHNTSWKDLFQALIEGKLKILLAWLSSVLLLILTTTKALIGLLTIPYILVIQMVKNGHKSIQEAASPPTHVQSNRAEIIIWRGRFRFNHSRKVAVIHDVSTRVHPECHTPSNVEEFDEFVVYVQQHAEMIATVSEHSRREIIKYLEVRPSSVRVMHSQINPVYLRPSFNRASLERYGLPSRYLLCVGTVEPRKNLRRLVEAFTLLQREGALSDSILALVGPNGWDDTFDKFLIDLNAFPRVRRLGFVPTEHMPSLYHFATAFVYPSIYEGFGLPVLEALCSSAVVLTSNVTSLAELAGDVVKTFDPHNSISIAEALLRASVMTQKSTATYRKRCRTRGEQLLTESVDRPSIGTLLTDYISEEH